MKQIREIVVTITWRQWADGHWEATVTDTAGHPIGTVLDLDQLARCLEQIREREARRPHRYEAPPGK